MSKMIMIPFALGATQQRKLRSAVKNGDSLKLRLSAAAIGAGKEIHLAVTETQAQRLMKRKQAGLGADVTFSSTALKQSAKHGSGFFSNLARKAASAGIRGLSGLAADAIGGGFNDFKVANMTNRIYKPILKKQSMSVENNDFIDYPSTQGRGFFGNVLKKVASAGIRGVGNLAADAIGGGVRKPKRKVKAKAKTKAGKGFFRKLVSKGVRGLGGLAADAISGSGVRKRPPIGIYSPEFGSGIKAPGY